MIAYFDCFSGISGDMTLGALVDAGVPLLKLKHELARLPVKGYRLTSREVKKAGMRATKVDLILNDPSKSPLSKGGLKGRHASGARRWKDIEKIIDGSTLSESIKQKGLLIFKRLFEAEARVHGGRFDEVHLHELGAVDCIVDIFGSLIGLDILGIDTIYSSSVNVGSGSIRSEHGLLPVPAPASVELLKGVPVYSSGVKFELTTPTGAALISSLSAGFGPMPNIQIVKAGVGAGDRDFKDQPNILRMFIGEKAEKKSQGSGVRSQKSEDPITVIETNIDDMNPQVYEYVMEKLFKAGALDVFLTQIIMKKGRPGIKLSVLCNEDKKGPLSEIILKETTSIGLRFYTAERKTLQREIVSIDTKHGKVRVKKSRLGKEIQKASPEYEDCRKIAKKFNIPLLEVLKAVSS
ncbi:MAG: nickel pincer cofactor biosynthesis protein LarC [Nitrospirae bacterium]|nr:nickel pincer cofactor biosynthesis protein LarC [Nitrospirota bacterium]